MELIEFFFMCFFPVKLCLCDTENAAKEQIQALQFQLNETHGHHTETLKACQIKANTRCNELEQSLKFSRDRENDLVEQLNRFSVQENQLRDKVQACEHEFSERMQASTARERDLNEKLAQLTRQLKDETDRRGELEGQLELAELRQRCISNGSATNNDGSTNTSSKSQMMENEVDSLRSVLELKMNEISELRRQNHKLQTAHDELPVAQAKISVLETRLEDLSIQYQAKVDEEQYV